MRTTLLSLFVGSAAAANLGPYSTTYKTVQYDAMDKTDKKISVFYPTDLTEAPATPFKFISYAHGMYGGGISTVPGYHSMGTDLASFGYVVAFHHSCSVGCEDDTTSLPNDPKGFGHYYLEQLKVIDWIKAQPASSPFMSNLDLSNGVGVCGHSMGGQSTLFSSSYNSTSHDIRAAVMHHVSPNPTQP